MKMNTTEAKPYKDNIWDQIEQHVQKMAQEIAESFEEWKQSGTKLEHEYPPSYYGDQSGFLVEAEIGNDATFQDYLSSHTGQSIATFESGMGLRFETYSEIWYDEIAALFRYACEDVACDGLFVEGGFFEECNDAWFLGELVEYVYECAELL